MNMHEVYSWVTSRESLGRVVRAHFRVVRQKISRPRRVENLP
jgi:hypothetical protein